MTDAELTALLSEWIAEITERPAPALTPATDLVADVGLDSLALAELAAKVRLTFKIKLRPGELQHNLTVGALIALLLERLGQAPR